MEKPLHKIKRQLGRLHTASSVVESASRRRVIAKFAEKYGLVYFRSITASMSQLQVIRGTTSSIDQRDGNVCVGSHDGYDMMFIERVATTEFDGYATSSHRWHIMQFDLHSHTSLPFVFVGTRQQSKTYYARLFSAHREVRHIDSATYLSASKQFQSQFTVVTSPAQQTLLEQFLTEPVTTAMAKHQFPFAIELQGDSLYVITEANQVTVPQLMKMMHYGLWLAKHLDENVS